MNRLTIPNWDYNDKSLGTIGPCLARLAAYENTGLEPEEFCESVDFVLELNKKLKPYMDAISMDATPVVRCQKCKYCTEHYDTDGNVPYWTCSEWDGGTDADGFCHYGERKDDAE